MSATAFDITYNGTGATLYAIVRLESDHTAWNGTALVAYVNANVGSYGLSMTDGGGDYYYVTVPATLPAGDYRVFYYEQAGGSPAITDLLLASEERHWDGATLSSSSSVTLSAYALTDLDSAKLHQGITVSTYDTILTQLINSVSAEIERITGILFKAREYRERYDGTWQKSLLLRHAPVQRINKLVYGNGQALSVTFTGSAIEATASVYDDPEATGGAGAAGGLRLISVSTAGVETATNLTFAAYPSVSVLVTAINAVSGWSAMTLNNVRTSDLYATAGEDAVGRAVTLIYPDRKMNTYRLDSRTGRIQFDWNFYNLWWPPVPSDLSRMRFYPDFQGIVASYRAGFETIPADVQLLCNEMVKEAYLQRTQNTTLNSYTLGPYSVTFSQQQAQRVRERLAPYIDAAGIVGIA